MVLVMGHWSMRECMRVSWVVLHGVHGSICVEGISRRRRRRADGLRTRGAQDRMMGTAPRGLVVVVGMFVGNGGGLLGIEHGICVCDLSLHSQLNDES